MLTEEQKEARRKGLGGSDAAPACGISPWKTPYQLYLEKRGEAEGPEDNPAMFWGRTLEPVIRQRYADLNGYKVTIPVETLIHPKYPWMRANVDGIVHKHNRILEIKTTRSQEGWGESGTDEIPLYIQAQVQHYLAVTSIGIADVAVLIGGQDFRIYEVEADQEVQEMLIDAEGKFWHHVLAGEPPEPTTFTDVKLKFGRKSVSESVQATAAMIPMIAELWEIKKLKKQKEELEAIIMAHLGEADTLVDGDKILATWKASKPAKRFDLKTFQIDEPELYKQYLKEGEPSRRFLLK